eukprot:Opistho-2@91557
MCALKSANSYVTPFTPHPTIATSYKNGRFCHTHLRVFLFVRSLPHRSLKACALSNLPQYFTELGNLTRLDLSDNTQLGKYEPDCFAGLTSLKSLDLSGCPLSSLGASAFTSVTTLEELYLRDMPLGTLKGTTFDSFAATLRILDLSHSLRSSSGIMDGLFDNLSALKTLIIQSVGVSEYMADNALDGLVSLESLTINGLSYTTIPSNVFDRLGSLRELTLKAQLSALPRRMLWNNTRLERLTLAMLDVALLQDGFFDNTTELVSLTISATRLSAINAGAFDKLTKLTELQLEDNTRLATLPNGVFDNMRGLRKLTITNSAIVSFADNIFSPLSSLFSVSLMGTRAPLPANAFADMKSLSTLTLSQMGLMSVPDRMILGASNLTELDLSVNNLVSIPGVFLRDAWNLRKLILNDNYITLVPYLYNCNELRDLILKNNNISRLDTSALYGAYMLQNLDLSGNALTTIPGGIFGNAKRILNLDLSNNLISSLPCTLR